MREDYLWDRSGNPDPRIQKLEEMLAVYRCPETTAPPAPALYGRLALAASLLLASAGALYVAARPRGQESVWLRDGRAIRVGETLETGAGTTATLAASAVGELHLQSDSRLRVTRSAAGEQRLALDRGALHALIWAPPREFIVDTPSATSIDLGCEYDLRVDPGGAGLLSVRRGWVAFQAGTRESFIPAGAACRTHPRTGPGLPYFEDASNTFRSAVTAFEAQGTVDQLLAEARPRDALTLWHLLRRAAPRDRARVAARFSQLVPGVAAEQLARTDPASLEVAWDALGLGDTGWWRTWKRNW